MKLLVVTPYFYPKTGGVEEHTFNLYKGLSDKGFEIVVVTTKYSPGLSVHETVEGLKIHRLPYQFKIANSPISFKWITQIKKIINKEKPDLIMAHSPVPFMSDLVILINNHKPVILKYHSGSMKKDKQPFHNLLISIYEKYILKKVIRKADYLICTSDFVRNKFLPEFKAKSLTITPGVDINIFKPGNHPADKTRSILFVGRIDKTSEWKGIKYLIDAFYLIKPKYPLARLSIVGNGDDLENQKRYVNKLSIRNNVDFLGPLKGKELVKEYQKSSLLVLPSTSEAESFGMVLIEAMACKKPVVGSKIGGIPHVIDHGDNGFLVPPKDPKALAGAIINILKNPELAVKMGNNGYQKVMQNYTWDKKIGETKDLIESVYRGYFNETYTI